MLLLLPLSLVTEFWVKVLTGHGNELKDVASIELNPVPLSQGFVEGQYIIVVYILYLYVHMYAGTIITVIIGIVIVRITFTLTLVFSS